MARLIWREGAGVARFGRIQWLRPNMNHRWPNSNLTLIKSIHTSKYSGLWATTLSEADMDRAPSLALLGMGL
jgi:hypothetical protein